jgi:hypothetical protein
MDLLRPTLYCFFIALKSTKAEIINKKTNEGMLGNNVRVNPIKSRHFIASFLRTSYRKSPNILKQTRLHFH